jgi:hypothetical protein
MRSLISPLLCLSLVISACDSTPTDVEPELQDPDGSGMVANATSLGSGAEGYLVNLDMETDEGWWFNDPPWSTRGYSTHTAHSGLRSLSLSHPTASGAGEFSYAGQYTPVQDPSGEAFTLSVRMKLEDVTGQGVAIAIRGDTESTPSGYAEAFATTQYKRSLVGTTDWMEVSVELGGLADDIKSITVYLILLSETSGTVYFDDVEFSSSDWVPIRTLQNGGFEAGHTLPTSWWRGGLGYTGFYFTWEEGGSWEGTRAVSISRTNASPTNFGFWAQTIFADDFRGGPATLKVRVKTDLVGQGLSIVIRGDDTPQPTGSSEVFATTQGQTPITGTQDWTEYTVTLDEVPFSIQGLTIYLVFLPETTGTVSFDAAVLTQ